MMWAAAALPLAALSGCAVPCVDDGLGQKFCPEEETAADEVGETSPTETDTTDNGDEAMEDDGFECPVAEVELSPQTPNITLLVDRSGSMDEDFGGISRWQAVGDTLLDPDVGVVAPLQGDIRFGLSLYDNPGDMCPRVESTPLALNALADMTALYQSAAPEGDTPTGSALTSVADVVAQDPDPGEKVIVLATDGEPDTCAQPNPDEGQPEAVAAAQAAYAQGVRTVIVSVGSGISADHLQDMANAGAGVQPGGSDAVYYQALDQASLIDAFSEIIAGVRECTIDLDTALLPEAIDFCQVTINDEPVPYDESDGWQLNGSLQIELVGAACDSIQDGEIVIEMNCDCEAVE
ncbi:hypothetical protein PPSIR1_07008 [Plesiocystis pacifica SIR-1]|uniref:VWFA domain-containing protein n=2 Tax=Plesiocystis pacifica TaxID=191768 RepID=A6G560_9BACT|nr:hypothetical protein PPSIR1_07008 [Plesiocystis pacifica SIR-1]